PSTMLPICTVAGQDVSGDPARAEALDRARDSALPTATGLLRPFGSPAIAADSIAIYVPVYRAGQPLSTPEDRRRALSSFVAATVHIGSMVEGALAGLRPGGGASPILFSLEDVTDPDPRLIFDGGLPDRERGAGAGHGMRKTVVIEISGRQWMVTAVPAVAADSGGFGVEIPLLWTGAVAVFGLMLTGLTYAFGIILENRASLRRAIASLAQREEELDRLAHSDPLTGLANRRHFFLLGLAEWSRVKRHGRALSVLMMDIDHFKAINDSHGHDVGDECLKAFAAGCRVVLRDCDLVARMGGEEFAVLLSEIALPEARLVAERLRQKPADLRVPLASGGDVRLTVSIGIAAVTYQDQSLEDVVRRADHALYSAKEAGRDRVVAFDFGDQHLFALPPLADSGPVAVAAASPPSSSPTSSNAAGR
ncbi:MAG: diguanylate cyclase, partial [Telmatospirillum sp.]|nr:diguanylate cyclase [Telmatospirillum sp.]